MKAYVVDENVPIVANDSTHPEPKAPQADKACRLACVQARPRSSPAWSPREAPQQRRADARNPQTLDRTRLPWTAQGADGGARPQDAQTP
jgi:hypothetical protein